MWFPFTRSLVLFSFIYKRVNKVECGGRISLINFFCGILFILN